MFAAVEHTVNKYIYSNTVLTDSLQVLHWSTSIFCYFIFLLQYIYLLPVVTSKRLKNTFKHEITGFQTAGFGTSRSKICTVWEIH